MADTIRVTNLRQFHRALKAVDGDLKRELEDRLRDAGQIVATDASGRFAGIDSTSAAGFKPKVRGFGRVVVQQTRRRTTGNRPDFGSLQMRRALLPALDDNQDRIVETIDDMLGTIGNRNGF